MAHRLGWPCVRPGDTVQWGDTYRGSAVGRSAFCAQLATGRAARAPFGNDRIGVQQGQTSGRPFGGLRVGPSDLGVERANSLADRAFVGKLPDPLDFDLDLAK